MRYLINLTYDGSDFYGYQIQNNKQTIEGELERVLSIILNEKINTIASSRTDKGVHAINQYAHFDTTKKINTKALTHSVNKMINDSIYIKKISKISDEVHARYSVVKKEYIYKINMGEYNPLDKKYILQYCKKIDRNLLEEFIKLISGKHNFKSFTSDKDKENYERELIIDYKISNKVLYLRLQSTGFFKYMIRNIVGLLLDINEGKKTLSDINTIFSKQDRTSCGRCAPSCGLYLHKIKL